MDSARSSIPWLRGSFALLLGLFVVAVALPNAGKVVIDHTTSPPTPRVEGLVTMSFIIVALGVLPAACIFFLGRRWIFAEVIGWLLLAYLVFGIFLM
jgi:hypothetical protein